MEIGLVIKNLRRKRGITQEKLAEYLNVTPQAVSRWECGFAYPEITSIPTIAAFFDVSCDILLGAETTTQEERIRAFLADHRKLASEGKKKERFALMKEAIRRFPGDFRILIEYAWDLSSYPYDDFGGTSLQTEQICAINEEVVNICQHILDDCTDDKIRYSAISLMSMVYLDLDEEKAVIAAERLPDFHETRNMTLFRVWDYDSDEHIAFFQENIATLADMLWFHIRTAVWGITDSEAKVKLCQKALSIYESLYENNDFGISWTYIGQIYETMADAYLLRGDVVKSIEALNKSLDAEVSYTTLEDGATYTSLLANKRIYRRENYRKDSALSPFTHFLKQLEQQKYDIIRETAAFRTLTAKAENLNSKWQAVVFANDWKRMM